MKKTITVGTSVVLILLVAFLTFQLTYHYVGSVYQKKVDTLTKTQSDFSLLAEADPLIREYFYGALDDEKIEDGLLRGYVSALEDPYSAYLNPAEYDRYQRERTASAGALGLRLTRSSKTEAIIVYSVFRDSPAASAGILAGDVISTVDGKSAEDLGFLDTLAALIGDEGTDVVVGVRREIASQVLDMEFTVTRQKVKTNQVDFELLDGKVGYVRIFSFDEGCREEIDAALLSLTGAGCTGVIFDVRSTAGGSATEAGKVLDRLLPEGVILRTVNHKGEKGEMKSDETCLDLPMSVLVDQGTSFAAELFAASLKDHGKAQLVGVKTYGKSLEQRAIELEGGAALLLTTMAYNPPSSPSFENVGVEPDAEIPLGSENLYLVEKEHDPQFLKALSLLK